MREIHPLGLVPYAIIMNALAYQVGNLFKQSPEMEFQFHLRRQTQQVSTLENYHQTQVE